MTIDNLKDEELFELVKTDNEEAFTVLYKRYWHLLLYKALSKLGSHHEAEEIVQDTMFQIWKYRKTIFLKYKFRTYLGSILAYKAIAKMASRKKVVDKPFENIFNLDVEDYSTQNNLAYSELRWELETSLGELPERCRLIFSMSRMDGKNYKEISTELDISTNTVKYHINKAIKILRTKIQKFYTVIQSFLSAQHLHSSGVN